MYLTTNEAWEVHWPDPAMAKLYWTWDAAHCPTPIGPLAAEIGEVWYEGAFGTAAATINGYQYVGRDPDVAGQPPSGSTRSVAEAIVTWEGERLPVIQQIVADVRGGDWESLDAAALRDALPGMIQRTADGFGLTIKSSSDLIPSLTAFLEFCGAHFGRKGPLLGMRMLQGHANASTDSARGLQKLARQAAKSEELRATVAAGDLDALASVEGGREFQNAFGDYLETYGWRLPGWIELHRPTWSEDPSVPLSMMGRYLEDGAAGPDVATASAVAGREQAISEAKQALDPDEQALLDGLLDAATGYVAVIEGRALWQQQLFACLRVPLMVLGEKLLATEVVRAPDDVFYLTSGELQFGVSGMDLGPTVQERRADLERWAALIPPQFLGTRPSERADIGAILMDGAGLRPSDETRVVNGFAASPGVVRELAHGRGRRHRRDRSRGCDRRSRMGGIGDGAVRSRLRSRSADACRVESRCTPHYGELVSLGIVPASLRRLGIVLGLRRPGLLGREDQLD